MGHVAVGVSAGPRILRIGRRREGLVDDARHGRTVLLVGDRLGATRAAERLGLRTLLLSDREPGPSRRRRLAGWAVVDFARAPGAVAAEALALVGDAPLHAVLALTERATLPAAMVRERLELPGLQVPEAQRCRDKVHMKQAIAAAGIPTALPVEILPATTAEALVEALGLPLVVKQRDASGGYGTRIVRERADLDGLLRVGWIAEPFVDGAEMSVETFMASGEPIFCNPTEYLEVNWASIAPASLSAVTLQQVLEMNRRALAALGVGHGIIHLELFLTADGPVFGEVAARPPGGHLMELLERAYGFCPWEALLRFELGERPELPRAAARFAGVWLLHPGVGRCRGVEGLERARAVPGVVDVRCRLQPGAEVTARESTGRNVGRILAIGASRDETARALRDAHGRIRFDMAG
jgi:biotin carboxylase